MSVITISGGSHSYGKEVAEKLAQKLGYECLSRDVLIEASKEFNVPEVKLLRAIRDAPSILDRFTYGKERYIAYFQTALLEHFQKDNTVYHGLAGHFFVKSVAHVLKVRITADFRDRVSLVMERDGIAEEQAVMVLNGLDEQRKKWGLDLYGIDPSDSSLYDLVIHLQRLSVDDAVAIIAQTASLDQFQKTDESQQTIDDLLLTARVRANLIDKHPRVEVTAKEGVVRVGLEGAGPREAEEIELAVGQLAGVQKANVEVQPFVAPL